MIKNPFYSIKMSWLKVIIFSVLIGVYTGLIMLVPSLKNTSFQDIGISYEWWVVFAVLIVTNCEKSYEAMLKCFAFFLISQPLVYITEVLLGSLSFSLAKTYYLTIWLPATLLTIPGGFIAYFCKKQNPLGAVVLGLGNTIESVFGVYYIKEAITDFPYHLLSGIYCFCFIALMSLCIMKKAKYRIISVVIPVILTLLLIVFAKVTGRTFI